MTEPIPADIRPGSSTRGSIGPPSPAASIKMIAPDRRAEDGGDRGERRTGGEHRHDLVRGVFLHPPHGQDRQAAAEGDERGLRSQHQAQAEGGQRGQQDARQLGRLGRPGPYSLVGDVAAPAGQPHDRDGRQHPGHRQHRQRPPPGDGMQSQPAGQGLVHLLLDPVDQFQEAPGGERDQHADHRGHNEQGAVVLAPDRRARVGRRRSYLTHRQCLPSRPQASRRRLGSAEPGARARVTSGMAAGRRGRADMGAA
ncbi:MAG TPA: hypothetical protein VK284_09400 [Streptosporangiaceae bacterium]|nr:hypothetical protein [Streptosporangiaceae bacterium]